MSSNNDTTPSTAAADSKVNRKELIKKLLKGIETGDPEAAAVVNEERGYIQHNPQTREGGEGLAALFQRISKSNPHVNIVRIFQDGDYVFGHTEYDFATRRIGFEVFRFDNDNYAVEHWDNIQPRPTEEPNASGHTMVDGPTEATDLDQTEVNRRLVRDFIQTVMMDKTSTFEDYMKDDLIQHNAHIMDGIAGLRTYYESTSPVRYETIHRVLAEGNFVLVVTEGYRTDTNVHTSFYDLYRVENGKLAEHWDTIEEVPPVSEWKNQNGKF